MFLVPPWLKIGFDNNDSVMEQNIQTVIDLVNSNNNLSAEEKVAIINKLKDADKKIAITEFKLDRTEKVKKTTAILLEETIEELEQKRKAVEAQNRELEIESALERVRSVAMSMMKADDLLNICKIQFDELTQLGFNEIRNAMINIYHDDKGSLLNYDYSEAAGKTITHFIYNSHPTIDNLVKNTRGANDAFIEYAYKGKELDEWRAFRKKSGEADDPRLDNSAAVYYYFYSIGSGSIGISTYNEISEGKINLLKRFRNVFNLSYQRYMDIALAEAQAREAQIEASLEKVRSRSLAMQKSDELKEVIQVVYDQLVHLNINTEHAGFVMDYKERDDRLLWVASKYGLPAQFTIPYFDSIYYNSFNEAKEKGLDFFATNLSFEEKNIFYKELFTHIPELPEENRQFYFNCPGLAISTVLLENIALYFENFEGIPFSDEDNAILMRFGKVFQQTYTRFLDLQKAEAQTRESQIQLALERARAQSMMMQHSNELDDALRVFHEQVLLLNIPSAFSFLWLPDEEKERHIFWAAWAEKNSFKSKAINYPLDRNEPATAQCLIDWKGNDPVVAYHVPPDGVQNYFAAWSELIAGVEELKPEYFSDGLYYVEAFMKYGCFGVIVKNALQPDEKNILARFAIEFERTYTRFLDLQKAEVQAKEARIEAALERVRSRSMAMHKSDELLDAAEILFVEMQRLDIESLTAGYVLIDKDKKNGLNYTPNPSTKKILPLPIIIPHNETTHLQQVVQNWKKGNPFFIVEMDEDETIKHQTFIAERSTNFPLSADQLIAISPAKLFLHNFYFKEGYVLIVGGTKLSAEQTDIMLRFTKVFQQTYTRFLDLQKAEAQAREAQIETGLERVRSRALAMHSTMELQDVIHTVHKELLKLNIAIHGGSFIAINNDIDTTLRCWGAGGTADTSEEVRLPLYEKPFCTDLINGIKKGPGFFTEEFSQQEKQDFFNFLFQYEPWSKLDAAQKNEILLSSGGYTRSCSVSQHTAIFIINHFGEKFSTDDNDILKRFGKTFEQAYTRFLDLQKAEAQAREGQIQLALERVRARTMAMQRSDELREVIQLIYQQLIHLNFTISNAGFGMDYRETDDFNLWMTGGDIEFPTRVHVPYIDHPQMNCFKEAKEKGLGFLTHTLTFDEKNQWFKYLFENAIKVEEERKEIAYGYKGLATSCVLLKNVFLYLLNYDGIPYSDSDNAILMRFGKVFEQTYTRFLDLQKAETQSRESQIQLALERVRARTMAMQKSEDMNQTASEMFKQIQSLGMQPWGCGFNIFDKDEKAVTQYMSLADGGISPPFRTPLTEDTFFINIYEGRQRGDELLVWESKGESLAETYHYMFSLPGSAEIFGDLESSGFEMPKSQITHCAYFSQGYLVFITYEPVPDAHDIFKRFAKVFEQTYTRFLDLQKAEAQAREAQIEMALEKVRSRSLAMHKSNELQDVVNTVFEQLNSLHIDMNVASIFIFKEHSKDWEQWVASADTNYSTHFHLSYTDNIIFKDLDTARQNGKEFYTARYSFEEKNNWFTYAFANTEYSRIPEQRKKFLLESEFYLFSFALSKNIGLQLAKYSGNHFSEADNEILKRFCRVFEQAYIRFLDLQKAEVQARQAKIEVAMEKVRSRAMAMQKPQELVEVAELLRKEMGLLGVEELETSSIYIHHEDTKKTECWYAIKDVQHPDKELVSDYMNIDLNETQVGKRMLAFYNSDQKQISIPMQGDARKEWINYCAAHSKVLTGFYGDNIPDRTYHLYKFSNGYMGAASPGEISVESRDLLQRATSVFSLAYTRFSDLKQAEANAREAKIETALERVRAISMSMMKSEDLQAICEAVFKQLNALGFSNIRASQIYIRNDKEQKFINYDYSDITGADVVEVNYNSHPNTRRIYDVIKNAGDGLVENVIKKEELEAWKSYLYNTLGQPPEKSLDTAESLHYYLSSFGTGAFGICTFSAISKEELDILKRFRNVFNLSYQRYIDISLAEEQAKEAKIEVALEKVRSRTLAMQKSDELADTAAEVFRQLIGLGIEPNRLYIGIVHPDTKDMEMWATDEDGASVGKRFTFNARDNHSVAKLYEGWLSKKKSVSVDMQGKELADYVNYLQQMQIPISHALTQKRRIQNVAYFDKGFIGMASPDEQSEKSVQLLERFAAVFNLTFTRFNDLKIAEAHALQAEQDLIEIKVAKQKAEEALTELQSTQKQLIQSEKMASLGELTAGIAHEIQNPLNFVNNFSEVSKELLDEMKAALAKGDMEEANEIASDVIQNLEKINHHGKRADGIVKGMLQHSRATGTVKESTDINALTDEYIRLCYHGLRAKDKSFNAAIETDFDATLEKVNIVPQDIGRVVLNILTNAFYAVNERSKLQEAAYKPLVTVSTMGTGRGEVKINITDNGSGIPKSIVNKIFQPFFTTKPTGQGTGLGLSLAYDIVKVHGGELKVETKEGEGTSFILELPA